MEPPGHLRLAAMAGLVAFGATLSLGVALHASGSGGPSAPNAAGEVTTHVPGVGDVISVPDLTRDGPVVLDRVHGQVTIPQAPGISWAGIWGEGDEGCDFGIVIFLPHGTTAFFCEETAEFEFIDIEPGDADTIQRIISGQTGYTLRPSRSTGELP